MGTAHVSRQSTQTVDEIIEEEMPDTVCVELCATRYRSLQESGNPRRADLRGMMRSPDSPLALSSAILVYFQKKSAKTWCDAG